MRLLLVTSDLSDGGGVNRVISNLLQIFSQIPGLEVEVFHAREFRGSKYVLPERVKIIVAQQMTRRIGPLNLLLNLLRLRSFRYDYVLSFWTQENILTATAFAGSGAKVVLSEHFCHDQSSWPVNVTRRWVYRIAYRLLVLNDQEFKYYSSFLSNVELLPNPVAPPHEALRSLVRKQNLILGVGHLIKRKGFRYLIEAVIAGHIGETGWKVKIVGEGPERAELQALIDAHHASSYITIEPPSASIDDWYRVSKLIVVPSLSEVFSMVIPEAMAHGVVPVAFAAHGPSFILKNHPELLVPLMDVAGLARQIRRLVQDPTLPEQGSVLQAEARLRFSYKALAVEWRRLLGRT